MNLCNESIRKLRMDYVAKQDVAIANYLLQYGMAYLYESTSSDGTEISSWIGAGHPENISPVTAEKLQELTKDPLTEAKAKAYEDLAIDEDGVLIPSNEVEIVLCMEAHKAKSIYRRKVSR